MSSYGGTLTVDVGIWKRFKPVVTILVMVADEMVGLQRPLIAQGVYLNARYPGLSANMPYQRWVWVIPDNLLGGWRGGDSLSLPCKTYGQAE